MPRESHLRVLRLLLDRMEGSKVDWAVTGSLGMALQGMDLPVNDIDIQTDEDGAYEMERRLAEFVTAPVLYKASQRMRSRLGKLMIEGIQVEIIGDIQKVLEDGSWEPPVRVADDRIWIDLHGLSIPVLSLEYEYDAYRLMGRTERAQAIRKWLDKHSGA
jgi:hypothetical protein